MKKFMPHTTRFIFIVVTFLAFLHTLSAAPTYTLTLTVPNGTTQHGNPHLFCLPPSSIDYIIFFSSNFFSHAATVINRPGASKAEKGLLFAVAVLFPGVGILRAYDVFVRCISWRRIKGAWSSLLRSKSTSQLDTSQNIPLDKLDDVARDAITRDLQDAARAGALIAIVRSEGWKPREGELKEIPGVKAKNNNNHKPVKSERMKDRTNKYLVEIGEQDLLEPTIPTAILPSFSKVSNKAKIHGRIVIEEELWSEYHLHILPPDTIVEPPPYPSSPPHLQTREHGPILEHGADKSLPQCPTSPIVPQLTETGESSQTPVHASNTAGPGLDIHNKSGSKEGTQDQDHGSEQVEDTYKSSRYPKLACTRNAPKIVLSVLQLIFGVSTLVRSTGEEQIQQFGYSAFSLAIAPYIFMSLINLLANLICPQYSNLFLVRTCAMNEMESRMRKAGKNSRAFFGVVGRVCVDDGRSVINWESLELYQRNLPKAAGTSEEFIQVRFDNTERNTLQNEAECNYRLMVPACEKFVTYDRYRLKGTLLTIRLFVLLFLITSPLAIDGGFSGFSTGPRSKSWERGFIQAWLWVGQVGGVGLGLYIPWVFRRWDNIRKEKLQLFFLLFITVLIGSPAIGGYVAVYKMLESYGNCTRLF